MLDKRGRETSAEPDGGKARILIVEDNEGIRYMLRLWLSAAGYEVSQACNGAEGLRRLRSEPFDLVVTDNSMPVKDGLTMIEEASILAPEIRFVVYSGSSAGELQRSERFCGRRILRILLKPMSGDEFVAAIRDAMARRTLADVENRTFSSESIPASERSESAARRWERRGISYAT